MSEWTDDEMNALAALHAEVDAKVSRLADVHAGRLSCGEGCASCCVDGLRVFEIEAERIVRHHAALLREGKPRPEGACAFLDADDRCRIYADRPYVCRTQGLPLTWIDETLEGPAAFRDICPLNAEAVPLETIDAEECWQIGPFEGRLAMLQAKHDGGALRRIGLRELFARRVGAEAPPATTETPDAP